jgi:hypothetical protein
VLLSFEKHPSLLEGLVDVGPQASLLGHVEGIGGKPTGVGVTNRPAPVPGRGEEEGEGRGRGGGEGGGGREGGGNASIFCEKEGEGRGRRGGEGEEGGGREGGGRGGERLDPRPAFLAIIGGKPTGISVTNGQQARRREGRGGRGKGRREGRGRGREGRERREHTSFHQASARFEGT